MAVSSVSSAGRQADPTSLSTEFCRICLVPANEFSNHSSSSTSLVLGKRKRNDEAAMSFKKLSGEEKDYASQIYLVTQAIGALFPSDLLRLMQEYIYSTRTNELPVISRNEFPAFQPYLQELLRKHRSMLQQIPNLISIKTSTPKVQFRSVTFEVLSPRPELMLDIALLTGVKAIVSLVPWRYTRPPYADSCKAELCEQDKELDPACPFKAHTFTGSGLLPLTGKGPNYNVLVTPYSDGANDLQIAALFQFFIKEVCCYEGSDCDCDCDCHVRSKAVMSPFELDRIA